MKNFAIKIFLIGTATLLPFLIIKHHYCTKKDATYWAVTKPNNSLITGLSVERMGIVPNILKDELGLEESPQNIALNFKISPYGKDYYEFITKKLKRTEKTGIHIIGVSKGGIMDDVNDKNKIRENTRLIYQLFSVNQPVNFEYIIKNNPAQSSFVTQLAHDILLKKEDNIKKNYHPNGWTECIRKGSPQKMLQQNYRTLIRNKTREHYLEKTIDFLSNNGIVFLVSMPIASETREANKHYFPDFNDYINTLATTKNVIFLDYSHQGEEYEYIELPGTHLVGESARKFTYQFAADIKTHLATMGDVKISL